MNGTCEHAAEEHCREVMVVVEDTAHRIERCIVQQPGEEQQSSFSHENMRML